MHTFRRFCSRVAPAVALMLAVASAQPVFADVPLPIIDIVPQQFFTTTGNAVNTAAGAPGAIPPNDGLVIGGTFTEPLFQGLSASYDNIVGGAFDTALGQVGVGPGGSAPYIYPGPARDVIQNYRLDYHIGPFNLEGGLGTRHRECCPYASFEWHKGFVGVSYASPHYAFMNGGFFVLDVTGNGIHYNHPDTTNYLAEGFTPGEIEASFPNSLQSLQLQYGAGIPQNKTIFTTQQAITGIIPVDLKHGVRVAATFLWGALDYSVNGPFPSMYDVWVLAGTKQFSDNIGFTANVTNVTQREQGNPFPAPGAIHTVALAMALDFHVDFHKLLMAPRPSQGRSTQPGVPGGPGGPAPVGPTQGGTVSPSPAPSPDMMNQSMPASSPAPAAPAPSPSP